MGNIIQMKFDQPDFLPIERKGRSSLVPFRLSIGSANNIPMSEKASRRSDLLKDFDNLNKESTLFKNSNLDFAQMLDFFQGVSPSCGERVSLGNLQMKPKDDLPSFNDQNEK